MERDGKQSIKVCIVERYNLVAAALRVLIESYPGLLVVGHATHGEETFSLASTQKPDVFVLDVDPDGHSFLDLLGKLLLKCPHTPVVVVAGALDYEAQERAVTLGATGLVLKNEAPEVLIRAIERVHAGEAWLPARLIASVLTTLRQPRETTKSRDLAQVRIETLTLRERQIVALIASGLKRKQIAEKLFISEVTVRNHLTSILSKLNLRDRLELAFFAYQHNLGKPPVKLLPPFHAGALGDNSDLESL